MTSHGHKYPTGRVRDPEAGEDLGSTPPPLRGLTPPKPEPEPASRMKKLAKHHSAHPPQPSPPTTAAAVPAKTLPMDIPAPEVEGEPLASTRTERRAYSTRSSTVRLPVSLIDATRTESRETGVPLGGIIVKAIEETLDILPNLLGATTRSKLGFSTTTSIPRPRSQEEMKLLSYSLPHDDFDILANLAHRLGAASVSQVIATALRHHHFKENHAPDEETQTSQ